MIDIHFLIVFFHHAKKYYLILHKHCFVSIIVVNLLL